MDRKVKYWSKEEFDEVGNLIRRIDSNGRWEIFGYDEYRNLIYSRKSIAGWDDFNSGSWMRWRYDNRGNQIKQESSHGGWIIREYDEENKLIFCESHMGVTIDIRNKYQKKTINLPNCPTHR